MREPFADVTLVQIRPVTQDLVSGRTKLPDGGERLTWIAPDGSGAVVASGPDGDKLQDVISTARTVDVDTLGCTTVPARPAWDEPRAGLPPVRLADDLSDVVGCVYARSGNGKHRLVASGQLDSAQRSALVGALSRAPAGAAPDVPQNCAPDLQEDTFALLRVQSPQASSTLTLHWEGCLNRYVAGSSTQSAMTERLLTVVLGALNVGYTFGQLPKG